MKIINKSTNTPYYETTDAACFDIKANEDGHILARGVKIIKTGLFLDVDHNKTLIIGYSVPELQIRARSSLAAKGIMLANGIGTVDFLYPSEIGVILYNSTDKPFEYKVGDRIAQGAVCWVDRIENIEVKQVTRTGGFGSTGK